MTISFICEILWFQIISSSKIPRLLILVMTSEISKLMENEIIIFHEIKTFLSCALKTKFSQHFFKSTFKSTMYWHSSICRYISSSFPFYLFKKTKQISLLKNFPNPSFIFHKVSTIFSEMRVGLQNDEYFLQKTNEIQIITQAYLTYKICLSISICHQLSCIYFLRKKIVMGKYINTFIQN